MDPNPLVLSGPVETTLKCHCCCGVIGKITEVGSRAWLEVDGLKLYAVHGRCRCGAELHWNAGDVTLARLIERAKKRKSL